MTHCLLSFVTMLNRESSVKNTQISILIEALFSTTVIFLRLASIHISYNVSKCTLGNVRPAKIRISPRIHQDGPQSSLGGL